MKKNVLFPYLVILGIAMMLEIFVFNWRSFQTLFYQEHELTEYYTQFDYGTITENGDIEVQGEAFVISIVPDGEEIHNVFLDAETVDQNGEATGKCDVQLYVQDELLSGGEKMVRPQTERKIFHSIPASQYLFYTPFGKTQMLQLDFFPQNGERIRIHDLRVNVKRPLLISGWRILLLFLFGSLITLFRPGSGLWEIKAVESGTAGRSVCALLYGGFLVAMLCLIIQNPLYLKQDFRPYQELARAFLSGSSCVGIADPQVAALEDSLVSWGRDSEGVKFDFAMFHGKYYVYFGVLPCLLFYLPWVWLTGSDLPDIAVEFILVSGILLGLHFLVKEIIRRHYPDTSLALFMLLMIGMVSGSALPVILLDPWVYNVAILSGVCLTIWGLLFWIKAAGRDASETTKQKREILFGSLLMAAVAAARPTLLLYSVLAIPIFYKVITNKIKMKKTEVRNVVCFMAPYCIVAMALMFYNYIRFENPFQFGMIYNMTIIPSKNTAFCLPELVWICVYEYLLRPLSFETEFPFLQQHYQSGVTAFSGTLLYFQTLGYGLFAGNPVLLGGLVKQNREDKKDILRKALLAACFIGLFLMFFSAVMTQVIATRYTLEFSFPLFVFAAVGLFELERRTEDHKRFRIIMGVLVFVPVLLQILPMFEIAEYPLRSGNEEIFYWLYYTFHS